jgi:hypothetical protein
MVYHDIQTLNDMAASLIANGESQVASKWLSKALAKVRCRLKDSASKQPNEMQDCSNRLLLEPTMFPVPRGVGYGPQSYAKEATEFYSTPFVFACLDNEEEESLSLNSAHALKRCGIACLFNLGLACHLAWVRNEQPHNETHLLLQKALEFYLKAYDAITQTNSSVTKNPTNHFSLDPQDSIALIVMALCTNIWHCHYETFSGHHELQIWRDNLLRALNFAEKEHKRDESFQFFCQFALFKGSLVTARAA